MRLVAAGVCWLIANLAEPLSAQTLENPDSLRPPAVSNADAATGRPQAAKLMLFRIREAMSAYDRTSLTNLLPDTLLSPGERSANRLKCRTLPDALAGVRRAHGSRAVGRTYLVISDTSGVQILEDGSVVVETTLLTRGSAGPIRFTFRPDGEALRLSSVTGLLNALCES